MYEVEALERLRICAGSFEPLLLTNVISNKILCAGSYTYGKMQPKPYGTLLNMLVIEKRILIHRFR